MGGGGGGGGGGEGEGNMKGVNLGISLILTFFCVGIQIWNEGTWEFQSSVKYLMTCSTVSTIGAFWEWTF